MAVTRLKRKGLRNKARAKQRQEAIKKFTRLPPIQKVDVEAIKEEFAKNGPSSQSKKETSASAPADKPKPEEKTASKSAPATEQKPESQATPPKAAPKSDSASEKTIPDTTAEVREPAKGSVEDAEMVEEKLEEKEEASPKVAPDVVSPEAGAPDETPSEADQDQADKK